MAYTSQQIVEFLLKNPDMTDEQIVKAMETYGVSPAQMATAVGLKEGEVAARIGAAIPANQAVLLGDTYVQAVNQVIGSGEDQQVGALENVITYKASENQVGGNINYYSPTGEYVQTTQQQAVDTSLGGAIRDIVSNPGFQIIAAAYGLSAALGAFGATAAGMTAAEAAGLGLTATEAAGLGFTSAQLTAAGYTAADLTAAGLTTAGATTAGATTAGATTAGATTAGATTAGATTAGATTTGGLLTSTAGLTATQIADLTRAGLTATQIANLVSSGATTAAGLLQQETSREAAIAAQAKIDVETAAAKQAAQFRPVGMTTRFGTSQFVIDPKTGQLTSAGYTLDPQAKNAQDRLVRLAEQGLVQAEGAQAQFAPLQTGAQSLFGLGQGFLNAQNDPRLAQIASQYLEQSPESKRLTALGGDYLTQSPESKMLTALGSKYIAQSPEAVAQNYLNQQMALLQPGRELELANLQNKLQQQGRGGLSVAQGGTLGATTPELQALYNARAQQEAVLAANAQQAGQQQVQFGAGLVGTGQQLGIQGQQFGAGLIGTGQQLGMAGQQFGMDTLARQQALEQQRIGFGSGLLSQGSGLLGQYYAGQQAAYAPYTTALGGVQNLEALAQQPFNMSLALAQQQAAAGAKVGEAGLYGARLSSGLATSADATRNPYASAISGVAANPAFGQFVGGLFGSQPATSGFSYGQYGTGVDPSTGEYFGSLYF
jgi:hypothetical protein